MINLTCTYSPEDNKLRLYSGGRLDAETYAKVKAEGFKYAPKQGLFVAPMWTPQREDLLIELCGEIGDEDTTLLERQEERAERFETYKENRANDAERAKAAVDAIADNIPFGQPILIGHHSEKHARKHAQQIENSMRKAVKMWETSEYWKYRAEGALRHAKYKELPGVRARRIKGIEANLRAAIASFTPKKPNEIIMQSPWYCPKCRAEGRPGVYGCNEHPEAKTKIPHVWTGHSRGGSWTAVESLPRIKKSKERWINHYENRLIYEKAILNEQGASALIAPKARPKQLPLLNYRVPEGLRVENRYHKGEYSVYPQVEMTKAEYAKFHSDSRGTEIINKTHRVRTLSRFAAFADLSRSIVFLTDSKIHDKPAEPAPVVEPVKEAEPLHEAEFWSDAPLHECILCTSGMIERSE